MVIEIQFFGDSLPDSQAGQLSSLKTTGFFFVKACVCHWVSHRNALNPTCTDTLESWSLVTLCPSWRHEGAREVIILFANGQSRKNEDSYRTKRITVNIKLMILFLLVLIQHYQQAIWYSQTELTHYYFVADSLFLEK